MPANEKNKDKDLRAKKEGVYIDVCKFSIDEIVRVISLFYESIFQMADHTLNTNSLFNDKMRTIAYRLKKNQKKSDMPVLTLDEDNWHLRSLFVPIIDTCKRQSQDMLIKFVNDMPDSSQLLRILSPVTDHLIETSVPKRSATCNFDTYNFYWSLLEYIKSEADFVELSIDDLLGTDEGLRSVIRNSYSDKDELVKALVPRYYFVPVDLKTITKSSWDMVRPGVNKYAKTILDFDNKQFKTNFDNLVWKIRRMINEEFSGNRDKMVEDFNRMSHFIFI